MTSTEATRLSLTLTRLRALHEAPVPESDDGCVCAKCLQSYSLRENSEPSRYCDACAHGVVEELLRSLPLLLDLVEAQERALVASVTLATDQRRAQEYGEAFGMGWATPMAMGLAQYDAAVAGVDAARVALEQLGD